jgi:hypothetical protein
MSMTFEELLESVDLLTNQEAHQLRLRLDERLSPLHQDSVEDRLQQFRMIFSGLRAELDDNALSEMVLAINEEHIPAIFDEEQV